MGPLSKIFRFFTLYVHSVSHTVPQNITTSVNQSPISTSFTRETGVLCLYFPLLTVVQKFSSDQLLSLVWLFVTPWTAARQASLSITSSWSSPKPMSIESVNPSNHLILCHPLLFPPSVFTSIRIFFNESVLGIRCKSIGVSASTLVLPRTPRIDLLQDGLVGSPCSPRDSQESSPTLQFKSINSLALSFLYSPTLTSIWPLEKP